MAAAMEGPALEKRCRWRKDKKEQPEHPASPEPPGLAAPAAAAASPQLGRPGAAAENFAAARAFQGLHGRKTDFALLTGAVDNAYQTVLGGNAFYYRELICKEGDFSMYESLVKELNYTPCWMSGGTPLYRPTAIGREEALKSSPTYEAVVRWLAGHFGVEPVRSLVNHYQNGDHFTAFHSDQYFDGVNMTIGASFGEERALIFEHKESKEQFNFPQHNGDIFAFTDEVNSRFVHGVPRERRRARSTGARHTPGRVSVILWARRHQPEWQRHAATKPISLLPFHYVLEHDPGKPETPEAELGDAAAAGPLAAPPPAPQEAEGAAAVEGDEA
ncbi:unnamed protein product, partial [Prorocentrum cordatum]